MRPNRFRLLLAFLLLLSPSVVHSSPITPLSISEATVPNTVGPFFKSPSKPVPDFDKEVLIPLKQAQAEKAAAEKAAQEAAEAAEAAHQAELVAEQQRAVIQAPVASQYTYASNSGGGNSYTPGQCTWGVKNWKPNVPDFLGDARNWGFILGYNSQPIVGSIAWTTAGWAGHVAVVTAVDGAQVQIEEMNGPNGPYSIDYRWTSVYDWTGFIYY